MTTVTTSKKKLVYKQDPDGVFRLKRLEPEPRGPDKKSVDDYLNDLVSCAYEVVDPNEHEKRRPDDDVAVASATSSVKSPAKNRRFSECDANSVSSVANDSSLFSLTFSYSMVQFHVPSFVCGILLALVVVRSAPQLWTYLQVFFSYAKVGIVWTVILGAGAWYGGLIKTEDVSGLKARAAGLFSRRKVVAEAPDIEESDDDADSQHHHTPARALSPVRAAKPQPPVLGSRRTTVTNVVPFKPLTRDQITRFQSNPELVERKAPPKLPRVHTTDPNVRRRYDDRPRRTSAASFESPRHRPPPPERPLPHAADHEELPFINEVRLVSQDDASPIASGHHHQPSMASPDPGVRRANTTATKNSILGTRANYTKFLETAQDLDYD